MSYDFRASQVKTNKIIASGSTGTSASIIIYGHESDGDPPNQGNLSTSFLTNSIGPDTFLYISGSEEKRSVFGGGLTLSGTVYALQGLPIGQTGLETYQEGLFEDWTGRTTVGAAGAGGVFWNAQVTKKMIMSNVSAYGADGHAVENRA